jgi:hypothetical protein
MLTYRCVLNIHTRHAQLTISYHFKRSSVSRNSCVRILRSSIPFDHVLPPLAVSPLAATIPRSRLVMRPAPPVISTGLKYQCRRSIALHFDRRLGSFSTAFVICTFLSSSETDSRKRYHPQTAAVLNSRNGNTIGPAIWVVPTPSNFIARRSAVCRQKLRHPHNHTPSAVTPFTSASAPTVSASDDEDTAPTRITGPVLRRSTHLLYLPHLSSCL